MSEGERWRCFVAVRLDDPLRRSLGAAIDAWRQDARTDGVRWVAPDALHVTLAFLGSVQPAGIADVLGVVERVAARHRPARLATGRLGAFHRPGSVRVLWYGVDDAGGTLSALASDLGQALGVQRAEPFRAHVTLARARRREVDLRGWIEAASLAAPEGTLPVERLELIRSHLGGGPARYETLGTFLLGGSPE